MCFFGFGSIYKAYILSRFLPDTRRVENVTTLSVSDQITASTLQNKTEIEYTPEHYLDNPSLDFRSRVNY
jgi:hypothetical protein